MGRRDRRKRPQGRAEGRVRGRVRERVRGRARRGGEGGGSKRGTFDVSAIEGYADRLSSSMGGAQRLTGAASGLAGAASGLAGASFAHRILGSDAESSEENFMKEVRERFDLIDERLHQLEDQMRALLEGGDPGDLQERGDEPDTGGDR